MGVTSGSRYITPTLQANWNLAISDVIHALNAGLLYEAWLALETLYDILPPDVYKGMQIRHDNIKKELESHQPRTVAYEDQVMSFSNSSTVLQREVRPFFREMYALLYDGGYLEKKQRDIETNAPPELLEQ